MRVEVVHLLHGAMDYESLLFPDGYLETAVSREQAKQQEAVREAFGQIPVELDLQVTRQGRAVHIEWTSEKRR